MHYFGTVLILTLYDTNRQLVIRHWDEQTVHTLRIKEENMVSEVGSEHQH